MSGFCVLSVATGIFVRGQKRLVDSLRRSGYRGDILSWSDELPPGSPSHQEAPFGFKPFAFKAAFEEGYDSALWLDSSYIVVRKLDGIRQAIRRRGYYFHSWASNFGEWCSDLALARFGLERLRSFEILEIDASCIGLGARHADSLSFLNEWLQLAEDGVTLRGIDASYGLDRANDNRDGQVSSHGRVRGHRQDQSAASFLAWKHRFRLSSKEAINYQWSSADGGNAYSRTIPFSAALLLCRDTKKQEQGFIESVDRYGNRKGLARAAFLALSLLATVRILIRECSIRMKLHAPHYFEKGNRQRSV